MKEENGERITLSLTCAHAHLPYHSNRIGLAVVALLNIEFVEGEIRTHL